MLVLLEYPSGGEVALFVVFLGAAADDDAVVGRGVDKGEDAGRGVCLDGNAGMPHRFVAVAATEEDEVAGLKVAGVAHLDA